VDDPGPALGEQVDLSLVDVDAVRDETVLGQETEFVGVLQRAHAVFVD